MYKIQQFFKKYIDKIVPLYAIIPLIVCFGFNTLIYYGAKVVNQNRYHYDFTMDFDRKVPFIPWFVIIYFGCYLFWILNYIMIARISKEHCMRFVFADVISRVVCGIFFLLIPTTNVRPEVIGSGICDELMRYLYMIDSAENLFPSIHCLVSWFCYVGIRGEKSIPKWYRAFSCIFAIVVCVSTQVTKQHYIIDVIGGIVIAEITYFAATRTRIYRYLAVIFDKISVLIFGKDNVEILEREYKSVEEQEKYI